jgi:hypothetical protein
MHLYLAFLLGNDYTLPENKSSVDVLRMPFFSAVSNEGLTETAPTSRMFMSFLGANFFNMGADNLYQHDKCKKKLEEYGALLTKFNSWVDAVVERRNGYYFIKDTKISF